jgi:hypothetical protein
MEDELHWSTCREGLTLGYRTRGKGLNKRRYLWWHYISIEHIPLRAIEEKRERGSNENELHWSTYREGLTLGYSTRGKGLNKRHYLWWH